MAMDDAKQAPGKRACAGCYGDEVSGFYDPEISVSLQLFFQRITGEKADEARPGGAVQPHSGIVLDIGFCDGEFGAFAGVEDRGHGRDDLGCKLAELLRDM